MSVQTKFKPTMYVSAYEFARDGLSDCQVAKALGVKYETLLTWLPKYPALVDALDRGRRHRSPDNAFTFQDYVFNQLPANLQETWMEINACEELENGVERLEALLDHQGIRARQHLFLYALTKSCFNVSYSLTKLNISRNTFETWRHTDPDFTALVDEIHWHKQNFFEDAFIRRVRAGDTPAVIHAVKTMCRDRGYGDKIEVSHSGTVAHNHSINITDLDLPIDVRQAVLAALRVHIKAADTDTIPLLTHVTGEAV